MNDVIIGTDTREPNVSIVGTGCYNDGNFSISHYGKYFKISHPWFKSDLIIFDNCDEYNWMNNHLHNATPSELEEFFIPLFIRNNTSEGIVDTLYHATIRGYIQGKTKVQNDMRKILGLK